MLQTVFLDIDDTLFDFHRAEAVALRTTLTELDVPSDDGVLARYSAINAALWARLEEGEITREEVLTQRFVRLFAELGLARSAGRARDRYETLLGDQVFLLPGALETLMTLSAQGYDVYLASNGVADVKDRCIARAGFAPYIRGAFISERIGCNKPDPAFFAHCFAAIPGFRRDAAIIVGDSLTSDMRGGIRAGIRTCWYNPSGKPGRADIPVDYTVSHLRELPPLFARLREEPECPPSQRPKI